MFQEKKAKETFQAGFQYLPFFLAETMANKDLIAYLLMDKLDIIRAKEFLWQQHWSVMPSSV